MSPDRTIAALRREVYLRKPEVFKMACLRDIKNLFGPGKTPFYAGFGNRLTDALSYRSVSIPSNRIFTINSYAEVSLDLLSLNKLKLSYVNMREVVDHYFPPVSQLLQQGGEEFTDFQYWRDRPMELDEFSDSDSDVSGRVVGRGDDSGSDAGSEGSEDGEDQDNASMRESYISQQSVDEGSMISQSEQSDHSGDEGASHYEDEDEDGSSVAASSLYESAAYTWDGLEVQDVGEAQLTPAQIAAQTEAEMEAYEEEDEFAVEASPTPLAERKLEDVELKLHNENLKATPEQVAQATPEQAAELLSPETAARTSLEQQRGGERPRHERRLSRDEYSEDRDAEIISGMKGMMIRDESRPGSRAPSADGSRAGSRTGSRIGGEMRRRAESNVEDIRE